MRSTEQTLLGTITTLQKEILDLKGTVSGQNKLIQHLEKMIEMDLQKRMKER